MLVPLIPMRALVLLTAFAWMTLSGCREADVQRRPVNVSVEIGACVGDVSGNLHDADGRVVGRSTCREELATRLADGVNACFVVREDTAGAAAHYLSLAWDPVAGTLTPAGKTAVPVGFGRNMRAALFFFETGFRADICTSGSALNDESACDANSLCVLKLSQIGTPINEPTADGSAVATFKFTRDGGGCAAEVRPMDGSGIERCDGRDNDCDGRVDEEFGQLGRGCENGVGGCKRTDTFVCAEDGGSTICPAIPGEPEDEVCNGLDDDCDGRVDEGVEGCCTVGQRQACGVNVPSSDCTVGSQVCEGEPGEALGTFGQCRRADGGAAVLPGEREEICDGIDNDCDGRVDEDIFLPIDDPQSPGVAIGGVCARGIGLCLQTGSVVCDTVNVTPVCDATPAQAQDERCDGQDNDCDGNTDEAFPTKGMPCEVGVGACASIGTFVCTSDGAGVECDATPQAPNPAGELCGDEIDNDCNGTVDEGFPQVGDACAVGEGICRNEGQVVCNPADRTQTRCSADPLPSRAETCNGLDDDCDGEIDEDFDLSTDMAHCGACNSPCVLANANSVCTASDCLIDACIGGYQDNDGITANGCECNPADPDAPDPEFLDSDCDGVDGSAANALFVSPDGNDVTGDGSRAAPFQTLGKAIAAANIANRRAIYLDAGTYDVKAGDSIDNPLDVEARGLQITDGLSIHGGYRWQGAGTNVWLRGPSARQVQFRTIVTGSAVVLRYQGITRQTMLDNLDVIATNAEISETPSVGVVVIDAGAFVTLRDVRVTAGAGAPGSPSIAGSPGEPGAQPGQPGLASNAGSAGSGGARGTSPNCDQGTTGGDGGNGQRAENGSSPARSGGPGSAPDGVDPAAGGPGAAAFEQDGQPGDPGDDGTHGDNNQPVSFVGRVEADGLSATRLWMPRRPNVATRGRVGAGGGGGGGGASRNASNGVGGGGGGGGAGGCAGVAATVAGSGGGSFALHVQNAHLNLVNTTLTAAAGGRGGAGAGGGAGSPGGDGGGGGPNTGCDDCGRGGRAGDGGRGGCGGHTAGGNGGPSVALLRVSTGAADPQMDASAVRYRDYEGGAVPGAPVAGALVVGAGGVAGAGGSRASCGPAAEGGRAGDAEAVVCCRLNPATGSCTTFIACDPQ